MYSAKPLGINIRQNDREVFDGFLQECINLQKRDGSTKPLPNRLLSDINTTLYGKIILHKVSDEGQINVFGFNRASYGFLAEDLSAYLGGGEDTLNGNLTWFGAIIDGVYSAKETPQVLSIVRTVGMSFTILNGLMYFMGNGTTIEERFYKRIQYNQTTQLYEEKDMYAWKSLIPFYPEQVAIQLTAAKKAYQVITQCGFILTRFTLVLKTGEEVLHSPIYFNFLYGLNRSASTYFNYGETELTDKIVKNIHTVINQNLEFIDSDLFNKEISAINVYASVPYYISDMPKISIPQYTTDPHFGYLLLLGDETLKAEVQKKAEEPFYLINTIESPSSKQVILSVGQLDSDIDFKYGSDLTKIEYTSVDIMTIAAGQPMPVDNYSYHRKYGEITSDNGRLVIGSPVTVLSDGHIRSLSLNNIQSYSCFDMDTEDGKVTKLSNILDKSIEITHEEGTGIWKILSRGILSYPDMRTNRIGVNTAIDGDSSKITRVNCRKNKLHNMSCDFDFYRIYFISSQFYFVEDGDNCKFISKYCEKIDTHGFRLIEDALYPSDITSNDNYSSGNAVQFSAIGEYSVWPAINSYRIGNGKIMKVGANNVDQKTANMISMLIVGTTDGVWSINTDPTGNNFVSSVSRKSFTPYISKEVLQVGNAFFFISDKGLMIMQGGEEPQSLSYDFFPGQGDGNLPENEDVYPNYNVLTDPYFDGSNLYVLSDVVNYLKNAKLAYDNRRNTIWCSNPYEEFSLIFDLTNKCWGMSTTVFSEAIELFSSLTTNEGSIESWYLVTDNNSLQPYLLILSGEDMETEVFVHLLTRPLKFNKGEAENSDNADHYKKIQRMFARCELYRSSAETGYFSFGMWGKQDINRDKLNMPLIALSDGRTISFPSDVRQDIPVGARKGKYKTVSILLGGQMLPDSSIDSFDFETALVDETLMR